MCNEVTLSSCVHYLMQMEKREEERRLREEADASMQKALLALLAKVCAFAGVGGSVCPCFCL